MGFGFGRGKLDSSLVLLSTKTENNNYFFVSQAKMETMKDFWNIIINTSTEQVPKEEGTEMKADISLKVSDMTGIRCPVRPEYEQEIYTEPRVEDDIIIVVTSSIPLLSTVPTVPTVPTPVQIFKSYIKKVTS